MSTPTSGAWQADPQLQQLGLAWKTARAAGASRSAGMPEAEALTRYIDANRQRLGIPQGYYVDPYTGGLVDKSTPWVKIALTGAAMAAGAYGLGAVLGGAPAVAGASGSALPAGFDSVNGAVVGGQAAAPAVSGASGAIGAGPAAATATAGATASAGTAKSLLDRLKGIVPNSPRDAASLAALIPLLTSAFSGGGSGGNNPFGDNGALSNEITQGLATQRKRLEQTQPTFDTLVNMSYGTSPTRYRGATPPAGYAPNAAPQGAYEYQGPRFS